MYHSVHHLGHTEAVPEIVEGVVSVILLNTQLKQTPSDNEGFWRVVCHTKDMGAEL